MNSANSGPNPQMLAHAFLDTVPKAMRMVRTEMRSVARQEMTVPQFRILAHLARSPVSSGELAESLGVSPPNLTRLSICLMKKEFVTCTRDPQDRRRVLLRLTPKGRARYLALKNGAAKRLEARFADLPAATRAALEHGFAALRILDSLDSNEVQSGTDADNGGSLS